MIKHRSISAVLSIAPFLLTFGLLTGSVAHPLVGFNAIPTFAFTPEFLLSSAAIVYFMSGFIVFAAAAASIHCILTLIWLGPAKKPD